MVLPIVRVLLVGALPTRDYGTSRGLGLIVVVIIVLLLQMGRIRLPMQLGFRVPDFAWRRSLLGRSGCRMRPSLDQRGIEQCIRGSRADARPRQHPRSLNSSGLP